MHELSLVSSILNIIDDYAGREGFEHVNSLQLSCGKLSGVDPQCLQFAFEVQSKDTRAEGAILKLDILPAIIHCLNCGRNSEVDRIEIRCPECGAEEVLLTGGTEELQLLELDVD
ncbi:MAG: hydrogenase nickel incorporation protein HybF [Syntrophus sp. PtaB.Bin001]|jgi:hydrogenase nickel incorporation protein HypA/HybF|nr:MAG: hydrogenase nickel incorporation protein HybF [Syntrophus sp. PtaB.Bin001]